LCDVFDILILNVWPRKYNVPSKSTSLTWVTSQADLTVMYASQLPFLRVIVQATLDQSIDEGSNTDMAGIYHVVLVRLSHIQQAQQQTDLQ